MIFICR